MVQELTKDNFKEVIGKGPTVVDFWASWCGPCQMLAPVFEEVSKDFEGKLAFAKVNVEEQQDLAAEYGIQSIPCLVVFKDGKEADRIMGFRQKDQLKADLEKAL